MPHSLLLVPSSRRPTHLSRRDTAVTDYLDNPAGRLAAALREVRRIRDGASEGSAMSTWGTALGAMNSARLLVRAGQLTDLIDEAKAAVVELMDEDERAFYLQPLVKLDPLMTVLLSRLGDNNMESFAPYLTDEAIYALEGVSRALRRLSRFPVLDEEARDDLLADVRKMIDDVIRDDTLSYEIKSYIVKLLRNVESALLGFLLGGFGEVSACIAAVAAGVAMVADPAAKAGWSDRWKGLWKKLVAHTDDVKAITSAGKGAIELIEGIDKLTS